jgi:hypothetical protein
MDNIRLLLEKLKRGEKLDSPILAQLSRDGYINASDVTNYQTPEGVREYLFIDFTEKGRRLLED